MNQSKSNRQDRKKRNQIRNKTQRMYFGPSYGIKTQTNVRATLQTTANLTTTLGTNGFLQSFTWNLFQGGSQLQDNYRYFEVTGWRLDVTLPSVPATTDSFFQAAVGMLPINFLVDGTNYTAPVDVRNVLGLPGSVNLKEGQKNIGKWFPAACKQVYPTRVFSSGGSSAAATLFAYFNDVGVNETAAIVEIYCDAVFYGMQYQNPSVNAWKFGPEHVNSCEEIDDRLSVATSNKPKSKTRK